MNVRPDGRTDERTNECTNLYRAVKCLLCLVHRGMQTCDFGLTQYECVKITVNILIGDSIY